MWTMRNFLERRYDSGFVGRMHRNLWRWFELWNADVRRWEPEWGRWMLQQVHCWEGVHMQWRIPLQKRSLHIYSYWDSRSNREQAQWHLGKIQSPRLFSEWLLDQLWPSALLQESTRWLVHSLLHCDKIPWWSLSLYLPQNEASWRH